MEDIRTAHIEELQLLPPIEESADLLLKEAEINNLPPSTDATELERSKCILVIGEPIKGFARLEEIDGVAHLEQLSVGRQSLGQGLGFRRNR